MHCRPRWRIIPSTAFSVLASRLGAFSTDPQPLGATSRSFSAASITVVYLPLRAAKPSTFNSRCVYGSNSKAGQYAKADASPRVVVPFFHGLIDFDFIGEHIHVKPVIPPHGDSVAPEIADLGFDRSLRVGADEPLMSTDAACCLTALSLTMLQHFYSSY